MSNGMVRIRGHHLQLLYHYFIVSVGEKTLIRDTIDRGKEFNENKINILRKLKEERPKILVTDTIDDFCKKCRRRRSYACSTVYIEDRADLRIYGLEVGVSYSLDYLLDKIQKNYLRIIV
jgi:hypothetical protein